MHDMCFILALASVFPFFLCTPAFVWLGQSDGSVFSISPLEIPHYVIKNSVHCYVGIKASVLAIRAD